MSLPNLLAQELKIGKDQIRKAFEAIKGKTTYAFAQGAMPMQDAIDLAAFLVEYTIQVSRFSPGAPTVGGPVEVAAISKHEGFKWVRRKHYYSSELNPEG